MKIIHTSDLHLGKRINEFSMLDDQRYILEQIVQICEREQADVLLLAGDIYDRPIPSAEAVMVFDAFLSELSARNVIVCAVSGNHDSAERIAFGSNLMKSSGVYFSGVYDGHTQKVLLADEFGELAIYLLPFVRPSVVRRGLGIEEIESYEDAVREAIAHMDVDSSKRNILVAHQFVTGAGRCDSEEIVVGGLDNVDASIFDVFDYTALGHIHSPQNITDTVRYCGTPLKYSVSEAEQEKSVTVIEMGKKETLTIRTIPLTPKHDLRKIRGSYMEVTARPFYQNTNTEDYVQITLTDEEDILDGMQKLRTIYPNLLSLEYDNHRTKLLQSVLPQESVRQKTPEELFDALYQSQNNQSMSEEQKNFVRTLMKQLEEEQV